FLRLGKSADWRHRIQEKVNNDTQKRGRVALSFTLCYAQFPQTYPQKCSANVDIIRAIVTFM
ncbi:MAG: hypothetical protein SPC78_02920, partial [Candidatus Faecousia sp.]|nr:hypothetical protein [Candidatus Faecousia sp.]